MHKNVFNKSSDGMLIIKNGKFIECNESALKMLGYEDKEMFLNKHPAEISPEFQQDKRSSYDKAEENTKYAIENGSNIFEWIHLKTNGEEFWVEVVLTNISTEFNPLFLVVWKEIGDKKQLEAESSYQQMLLTAVLNSSADLIFYKGYTNGIGKYIGCNAAYEKFVGKTKEEIVGKSDIELFGKDVHEHFVKTDFDIMQGKTDGVHEKWVTYPNGDKILLQTKKSVLVDENKNIIGIMGIARDITTAFDNKIELNEHKFLANTDPLTGIANRRSFFNISEQFLKTFSRTKSPISLMMIDIDHFKKINDAYGHTVGDDILKYVVNQIKNRLRKSDTFARYGGEEFIILLPNTDEVTAISIAEEIRFIFSNGVYNDEKISIPVKVSIGVGACKGEPSMREFIKRVDSGLYKAKTNGRNRVENI